MLLIKMAKTVVLIGFVASLLFLSLIAYSFPIFAQGPDSAPGKPEVIAVSGIVPGKDLIVHIWVVVPPGTDKHEAAAAALANQGARPFTHDEFTTIALKWDQFSDSNTVNDFVIQNYNPVNDPTGGGITALTNTHSSWNSVKTSIFAFKDGGLTDRCPSLVKECRGPQTFDGFNDVAWLRLSGSTTLGVTWSGTSIDEADMALNTKFNWVTDFDVETVYLHENGHVAGLGHSAEIDAIMYPSYQKLNRYLLQDDKDGINFLYPPVSNNASPTVSITSPVNDRNYDSDLSILFTATASDFEDGPITDISWTSSEDGLIPLDASEATLSDGSHIVTATVTDLDGNTSSDSVTITVGTSSPPPSSNLNSKIEFTTDVKKRFNNLLITVSATDGSGSSVSNVSVQLTLERDGGGPWNFGGSTDETGSVTFKLMKAKSNTDYTATITNSIPVFDGGELDDCAYINSENIAVTCSP